MPQSKPPSEWRTDDDTPDRKYKKVRHYDIADHPELIMPDHKIVEIFMEKHDVEAAVVLRWTLDGSTDKFRGVFPLSKVDGFSKIGSIIAGKDSPLCRPYKKEIAVHMDKFTISFVDFVTGTRFLSNNKGKPTDPPERLVANHTAQNYAFFMQAVAARVSGGPFPCTCDNVRACDETKLLPEISLTLSAIDKDNRRKHGDQEAPVHIGNIIFIDRREMGLPPKETKEVSTAESPKLMIRSKCLRKLVNVRNQDVNSDDSDDESLLSPLDESLFDDYDPNQALLQIQD